MDKQNPILAVNLIKEIKELYNKIFMILKKQIKKETKIQKGIPCPCVRYKYYLFVLSNIMKVSTLSKATQIFNEFTIKILTPFFTDIENVPKLIGNHKRPMLAKAIPNEKEYWE